MSRILRHVIPVDDQEHLFPGMVVHVATRAEDVVEAWVIEAPDGGENARPFAYRVVGTGHQYDGWAWGHVGSAVTPSGQFVWHLLRSTFTAKETP